MTGLIQVSTATEHRDAAVTLAGEAVRLRLAASAQIIGPVTSVFWHLGEYGTGEEWKTALITTKDRYAELEAFILANHPWQNPQVTAVEIVAASAACATWAHSAVNAG
ncbi:divalent cation tolerance protein [Catellatospora sp. TT07R-123]|uniref:divalent-cation tolerance protein CutA n=1 Tax=Catellatospora sp. TT07R-123 TaxID=2733863 RepID=UPI001AFD7A17|nr:divalent cation tolerance protein CutA [Catellatospora sp. TT07R-123]GHJ48615.1 divalent cation tolerance protein [Catellatospora sp. TT07R-123]